MSGKRLPQLYLITGEAPHEAAWWQSFERLLEIPGALIQLRLRPDSQPPPERWLAAAVERCKAQGRPVVVNGEPGVARAVGADGVHLNSCRLFECNKRPLPDGQWVGASCHDADELRQAEAIGADFVCLSPLFATASHPGRPALGMDRFGELARAGRLPVYALGGVGPEHLEAVTGAGGHGIAGISAFWGA
ncbi:MAG TPA: thiamine phosphate synthase [Xanthomonadales bacterium]|nr:thiamine phosphate synthase [Xanthomonadales bacterium]